MKTHNHKDHFTEVAEDTRALLEATANATEDAVVEARDRLKAAVAATSDAYLRIKQKAVQGAKTTDKMIRAKPYQALGIAFGVGALLGFFWSRRSRD